MAKIINKYSFPPKSKESLLSSQELQKAFTPLIGVNFKLAGKPRTDGSNLRKLIAQQLDRYGLPEAAINGDYNVVAKKGVPRILINIVDTYIVTSGESYNLQVWNRAPNSDSVLVNYSDGSDSILNSDIIYVLVKIDTKTSVIDSISILSADYIESRFGKFGRPTIKHQLLVSNILRNKLCSSPEKLHYADDTVNMSNLLSDKIILPTELMSSPPEKGKIIPLSAIKDIVSKNVIGINVASADTKSRGQLLEKIIAEALGYKIQDGDKLVGGYPDIPNQLLEVKIQDKQTIDLGKFSPQFEEVVIPELGITTRDIRYLIALTDSVTNIIEGVILMPGAELGKSYTYVSDTSYKCQRSISMTYFDEVSGQCVVNPEY